MERLCEKLNEIDVLIPAYMGQGSLVLCVCTYTSYYEGVCRCACKCVNVSVSVCVCVCVCKCVCKCKCVCVCVYLG